MLSSAVLCSYRREHRPRPGNLQQLGLEERRAVGGKSQGLQGAARDVRASIVRLSPVLRLFLSLSQGGDSGRRWYEHCSNKESQPRRSEGGPCTRLGTGHRCGLYDFYHQLVAGGCPLVPRDSRLHFVSLGCVIECDR